ncbi:hypothetical protein HQ544_03485 [Candidatus Falkowbacteria bacterium]|nr:hypothetical protein [Candidatus Falkowbacteria bacterium]
MLYVISEFVKFKKRSGCGRIELPKHALECTLGLGEDGGLVEDVRTFFRNKVGILNYGN